MIVNCSDIDCIFVYVAGIISMNYDDNESSATHPHMCSHWVLINPFAGKSLQIYNEFVLTVSRLNRDTNNSLAAVRLPIRKPGPHNSCGPVGTLK